MASSGSLARSHQKTDGTIILLGHGPCGKNQIVYRLKGFKYSGDIDTRPTRPNSNREYSYASHLPTTIAGKNIYMMGISANLRSLESCLANVKNLVVAVVIDVTSNYDDQALALTKALTIVCKNSPRACFLLPSKCDNDSVRQISADQLATFARENKLQLLPECSALKNINIRSNFETMAKRIPVVAQDQESKINTRTPIDTITFDDLRQNLNKALQYLEAKKLLLENELTNADKYQSKKLILTQKLIDKIGILDTAISDYRKIYNCKILDSSLTISIDNKDHFLSELRKATEKNFSRANKGKLAHHRDGLGWLHWIGNAIANILGIPVNLARFVSCQGLKLFKPFQADSATRIENFQKNIASFK